MKEREVRLSEDLMELQKKYNKMVKDLDRWKESYKELLKTTDTLRELLDGSRLEIKSLERDLRFYQGE